MSSLISRRKGYFPPATAPMWRLSSVCSPALQRFIFSIKMSWNCVFFLFLNKLPRLCGASINQCWAADSYRFSCLLCAADAFRIKIQHCRTFQNIALLKIQYSRSSSISIIIIINNILISKNSVLSFFSWEKGKFRNVGKHILNRFDTLRVKFDSDSNMMKAAGFSKRRDMLTMLKDPIIIFIIIYSSAS